ncbi:uncharacterized protein LOC128299106 [Anopheles moucheti]|uniref:uncharacterized protein LOC128299106 n=1 Tax=Anopheles moucheti TaxID=186751 RepID=UPI0022F0EF21|nr:uncharacterized protein LOC128299106 [Anopheles moucheti]
MNHSAQLPTSLAMEYELMVPTSDEKDFCHFCFGATNVHLMFPFVRPNMLTTIDNIIGISITPEAQKTFSLCGECISNLDMVITFRNKCRSHYEKLREMKIMNQAVKRMFPTLWDNMNQSSTFDTSVADTSINVGEGDPNVTLVKTTPKNARAENDDCNESGPKRSRAQALDFDPETSTKTTSIKNGTNHKAKFHHIREIMNRFRNKRLQSNDVRNGSGNANDAPLNGPCETSNKAVSIECQSNLSRASLNEPCPTPNKVVTVVHQLNLDNVPFNAPNKTPYKTTSKTATRIFTTQDSSNQRSPRKQPVLGHRPNTALNGLNGNTSKNQTILCSPCVVVLQKFSVHKTDLCKS